MYQEMVDKCKKAYKDKNLKLAYQYWCEIYDILDKKLSNVSKEEEKKSLYMEFFDYIDKFTDEEVYDITDYGKEQAYIRQKNNNYETISFSKIKGGEALDNFCDFYEWEAVKTENGFNIVDLQLDRFVEDNDYETFEQLVDRVVGRAIDYFKDEEDLDEIDQSLYEYGLSLYNIAKDYIGNNKYDKEWLEDFRKLLEELKEEL